ncbi:MAG: hypothetical protein JXR94_01350 [Candidatus Hydrogenedentes bacterium]|nr:hypothetical protein [Candidatus Hydrogenedentota bacterium]
MATDQSNGRTPPASVEPAGVPLGGVGAGSMCLGRDGRFRHITINNNRTADERIDVADGTFLAVRATERGKVNTRILQADSGLPFAEAGLAPAYTPPERLSWRGLYPCAHYELDDRSFPVDVRWSAMTPIVPYDIDASCLPLVFLSLYVRNSSDTSRDVSAVFNWENLCGCTRHHRPNRRGPIRPVLVKEESHYVLQDVEPEENADDQPPRFAGLEFGFRGECRSNAEGNYCLLAKQQQEVDVSFMAWNERNPSELRAFWQQFHDEGRLGNVLSRSPDSHSGAVCCSFTLPPHKGRSVVFVFSWYCPRFVVGDADMGNGYANTYADSLAVANRALTHYRYYFRSVENWQNRFLSSSLPRWFSKVLLNSNYVFSTNTLFTKGGDFAMMETPADPLLGAIDRRFHSSLGTLLLFPEFEQRELALFAASAGDEPGHIRRYLGRAGLGTPTDSASPGQEPAEPLMDINAKFVLMAYRNYQMTGKLYVLEYLYPRLKDAMEYMVDHDADRDGLPEGPGYLSTYEGWPARGANSYSAGLWLAAVRAYARLTRRLNHVKEAERYDKLLAKGVKSFEKGFWNADAGYYGYAQDAEGVGEPETLADACHAGQLAGQWYADFLCLGHLFQQERIEKALGAMCRLNEKQQGVAEVVAPDGSICPGNRPDLPASWPAFAMTHYCCLLMSHGYPDRALYVVQKACKNIHARRGRAFNQPFGWDLDANDACGWGAERHMGAPSVWHVLYALQGFFLNMAEQALWLRPHLPRGVHYLSTPLFTPVCLGWVKFREEERDGYQQRVEISFDSPIGLKTIVLRVPDAVAQVQVHCVSSEGVERTKHLFGRDGPDRLLEILPERPITVSSPLVITVTQTQGGRVVLDQPANGQHE